jgi:hypothetical protein
LKLAADLDLAQQRAEYNKNFAENITPLAIQVAEMTLKIREEVEKQG